MAFTWAIWFYGGGRQQQRIIGATEHGALHQLEFLLAQYQYQQPSYRSFSAKAGGSITAAQSPRRRLMSAGSIVPRLKQNGGGSWPGLANAAGSIFAIYPTNGASRNDCDRLEAALQCSNCGRLKSTPGRRPPNSPNMSISGSSPSPREMQHPFLLGEDQMINSKIARSEKDSEAIWRLRKLNPSS
jgi:hypothetical protein